MDRLREALDRRIAEFLDYETRFADELEAGNRDAVHTVNTILLDISYLEDQIMMLEDPLFDPDEPVI